MLTPKAGKKAPFLKNVKFCNSIQIKNNNKKKFLYPRRNVLGTKNLGDILSERESIANMMQSTLDEATDPWGVKVERVEV